MKVGILTVHRAHNYGSVLQCYAMQEYLRGLGFEVSVIDYRQPWTEAVYKVFSPRLVLHYLLSGDLHFVLGYWRQRKYRREVVKARKPVFTSFLRRFVLTRPCRFGMPCDFDIYLIGSDQLWTHQCMGGEDRFYLGDFRRPSGSRLIGYSISVSDASLRRYGAERMRTIVSRFDALSFREKSVADSIKAMTGRSFKQTLDPTLLVGESVWRKLLNDRWTGRRMIMVYQVREVPGKPGLLYRKACELAGQTGCEVVDFSEMSYSVEDFLSAISCAEAVVTTSFHAVVFSAIFKTPCCAFRLGDGLDFRYADLLHKIGLANELYDIDAPLKPGVVDFSAVPLLLEEYRAESDALLKEALRLQTHVCEQ